MSLKNWNDDSFVEMIRLSMEGTGLNVDRTIDYSDWPPSARYSVESVWIPAKVTEQQAEWTTVRIEYFDDIEGLREFVKKNCVMVGDMNGDFSFKYTAYKWSDHGQGFPIRLMGAEVKFQDFTEAQPDASSAKWIHDEEK